MHGCILQGPWEALGAWRQAWTLTRGRRSYADHTFCNSPLCASMRSVHNRRAIRVEVRCRRPRVRFQFTLRVQPVRRGACLRCAVSLMIQPAIMCRKCDVAANRRERPNAERRKVAKSRTPRPVELPSGPLPAPSVCPQAVHASHGRQRAAPQYHHGLHPEPLHTARAPSSGARAPQQAAAIRAQYRGLARGLQTACRAPSHAGCRRRAIRTSRSTERVRYAHSCWNCRRGRPSTACRRPTRQSYRRVACGLRRVRRDAR